jgi:hypothetical protein
VAKKKEFPVGPPDEPAFVPGRWYLYFATGGFTLIGQYVCPLGNDKHRFRHAAHMRNAGGLSLAEICAEGPGPNTKFAPPYPGYWNGYVHTWHDYYAGAPPWAR